jgi:hypothetical protein
MRTLSAIILVGLLTTIGVAGSLWLKIGDERVQTVQLRTRIAELEAATAPSAKPPVPVPVSVPIPAPAITRAPAANPDPVVIADTARQVTALPDKSMTTAIKQVLASPKSNGMMRMTLQRLYPDVTKELGVSQEQADQLIDVLARQQAEIAVDELGVLSGEVADPAGVREVQRKVEDKRRAAEAELTTLLGSKYGDWQRYQATAAARLQIESLQGALGSNDSLSESQSKSLLVAFADTQNQITTEHRSEPEMQGSSRQEIIGEQIKRLDKTNQRMLDAASPILTSPQLEIYKRSLDQVGAMMRATMRAMSGDLGPPAATP